MSGLSAPAMAQASDIDFGDDSSQWAKDGECDDPRFTGTGMAKELEQADLLKDATDCKTLFDEGKIALDPDFVEEADASGAIARAEEIAKAEAAADDAEIDFGDDSSTWAKDGECDDLRFSGTGMAEELLDEDIGKDATDCKTLFDEGKLTFNDPRAAVEEIPALEIDFGDDSGDWAKDGECDDPRFSGSGMATTLLDADLGRDATDCRSLFESGAITFDGDTTDLLDASDIDFGDDSGDWANDLECDDPRFTGPGMAIETSRSNILSDASDCRAAYQAGEIWLTGADTVEGTQSGQSSAARLALQRIADRIDFGDDSGEWTNDGECDDSDFFGPGTGLNNGDTKTDASDCRAAFIEGTISLRGNDQIDVAFDYGDDSSRWANDGECDDPRFGGPNLNKKMLTEDMFSDASDCRAGVAAGDIFIKPVFDPAYALGGPYDSSGVDFGDDTSDYADDGQCDDPRFEGPGMASITFDSDARSDASDCKALFEAGKVVLKNS